jgi:hypothetical protein
VKKKIIGGIVAVGLTLTLTACGSPTKSVTVRDSNQVVLKLPDDVKLFCHQGDLVYAKDEGGIFVLPNSPKCDGDILLETKP